MVKMWWCYAASDDAAAHKTGNVARNWRKPAHIGLKVAHKSEIAALKLREPARIFRSA
ncbi:hypothetical protein UACE39S_00656 [Ureibacillus acetophenoni]